MVETYPASEKPTRGRPTTDGENAQERERFMPIASLVYQLLYLEYLKILDDDSERETRLKRLRIPDYSGPEQAVTIPPRATKGCNTPNGGKGNKGVKDGTGNGGPAFVVQLINDQTSNTVFPWTSCAHVSRRVYADVSLFAGFAAHGNSVPEHTVARRGRLSLKQRRLEGLLGARNTDTCAY